MFKKLFKKDKETKNGEIFAIQSGEVVAVTEVPDAMFAQKILGDGVGLIPEEGSIYSPVSGTVDVVANTSHAVGIKTNDGLDVLVHIGLETVGLEGKGFDVKVKVGDKVKAGDLLVDVDLNLLKEKGFEIITPIIITNMDDIKELKTNTGKATAKETVVIEYTRN
ncbi:MAG: glucose PTS transporter subunit IIA [Miniphocaeibacter sp.]|uniref:PTS sugar transporter subunit IIA n=1 Tax=Miniphocaeibacter sp. TaxID=3100973 RepID=UPI0017F3A2A3|nr:PTS glucose transporter subunit IIA [Gallicola sp.]